MENQQIYKNPTSLVRIDAGYRDLLKIRAAQEGKSIKELLEECLAEFLGTDK